MMNKKMHIIFTCLFGISLGILLAYFLHKSNVMKNKTKTIGSNNSQKFFTKLSTPTAKGDMTRNTNDKSYNIKLNEYLPQNYIDIIKSNRSYLDRHNELRKYLSDSKESAVLLSYITLIPGLLENDKDIFEVASTLSELFQKNSDYAVAMEEIILKVPDDYSIEKQTVIQMYSNLPLDNHVKQEFLRKCSIQKATEKSIDLQVIAFRQYLETLDDLEDATSVLEDIIKNNDDKIIQTAFTNEYKSFQMSKN